jgi:hypothetical protein
MSDWCQVSRGPSDNSADVILAWRNIECSFSRGSFGGGWDAARGGGPPEPEDADAYARRLWEEMQRRQPARAAAAGPSAAARDTWGAADAAARARDGR